ARISTLFPYTALFRSQRIADMPTTLWRPTQQWRARLEADPQLQSELSPALKVTRDHRDCLRMTSSYLECWRDLRLKLRIRLKPRSVAHTSAIQSRGQL